MRRWTSRAVVWGLGVFVAFSAAARAAAGDRPVRVGVGMPLPVLKVDEKSITVKLKPIDKDGPTEGTWTLDGEKTRVRIGVAEEIERNGQKGTWYTFQPGK